MAVKGLGEMLHSKLDITNSAALLVDVISHYTGPKPALEDALQKVADADVVAGHTERSEELVEALIQRLLDATEEFDFVRRF
jgi:cohesin loading factor subunit SCC2